MTKGSFRLEDYLAHILEAIDRIVRYTQGLDKKAFLANELIQDAVVRNFEIIGEASRCIDKKFPDFSRQHTNLALSDAYRLRNAVIHGYFAVDYGVVWNTIIHDLPAMKAAVESVIGP